ncbi:hypothetical protein [Polyangium jinanense]|uniref:Uncharacterized protein n=1 Tax=Polyangium jinanense TaxID=2829994 RepID=A0A9X4AQY0_9BACT|nr:hypothetical protein [Polyangium jinanense]MDC3955247.1 hypothetical protein [Polyangium jinanense]MDC3981548.1 hypothetical protein [Polyangium jinanense]
MRQKRRAFAWTTLMAIVPGVALAQSAPPAAGQPHKPGIEAAPHGGRAGKPGEGHDPNARRPGEPTKPGEPSAKPGDTLRPGPPDAGAPPAPRREEDQGRAARRKAQVDKERPAVEESLKRRPMDEALQQEMKHHAERIARLERIQKLAEQSGDTATAERAKKVLEQENARYSKFIQSRK